MRLEPSHLLTVGESLRDMIVDHTFWMIRVAGSGRSGTRRRGHGRLGHRVVLVVFAAQLERLDRPLRRSHVLGPQRKLLRLKDILRRRTVLSHPVDGVLENFMRWPFFIFFPTGSVY